MTAARKLNEDADSGVIEAFKVYENFCRSMLDAYVVLDEHGRCVKFNQLLCQLVGRKSKQIMRADSFDEIIRFNMHNQTLKVQDIIGQSDPTRFDEVRGSIPGNDNLNLIMGIYPFKDDQGKSLGAFVLIRDVTAETNLQGKYKDAQSKSITDPLTGLFTRGYFEDYLKLQTKTILELPENSGRRLLSLVMLDIDHFKKVNDVHGHQAGDYILQEVAEIMKKSFRKTDIVCRYGGEEFLIILPATDLKGSAAAAEKLRANIEAEKITFEGTHIPITISLGVAQIILDTETYSETIARADGALYEAKRGGRNQVKVAE